MKQKLLTKAVLGTLAATGLSLGAMSAQAESHAVANVTVSNLSVTVDNAAGAGSVVGFANFTGIGGGLFNFVQETTATLNGVNSPGSVSSFTSQTSGGVVDPTHQILGGAVNENGFVTLGDGAAQLAQADGIMSNTFVTGPNVGVNAQMVAEADVQGPPVPISGSGSVTQGTMRWTFCTPNNTNPNGGANGTGGCAGRTVTNADTINVAGLVSGTILAQILSPLDVFDTANASATVSATIGGQAIFSTTFSASGTPGGPPASTTPGAVGGSLSLAGVDLSGDTVEFIINITAVANATSNSLVPEPGSLALMGTGLLALGAVSRRRRKLS